MFCFRVSEIIVQVDVQKDEAIENSAFRVPVRALILCFLFEFGVGFAFLVLDLDSLVLRYLF